MRKIFTILLIALSTIASGLFATSAVAQSFTYNGGPLTNLDPNNATINGNIANFPSKAGLYMLECIAPIGTARPVTCSDTVQLWLTLDGAQGSTKLTPNVVFKPTGTISGKGVVVDCTISQCGIFFRLAHPVGETDFSEDFFIPISFSKASTSVALAADLLSVSLNGAALTKNVPVNLGYRAVAKIVATSKSGVAVTVTSATPECSYLNGVLTPLKGSGVCAINVETAGDSVTAKAMANYPFLLKPGVQEIPKSVTSTIKSKALKLPVQSNFGELIAYSSLTSFCSIKSGLLTSTKGGTCSIRALAPAKAGMWEGLNQILKITIK